MIAGLGLVHTITPLSLLNSATTRTAMSEPVLCHACEALFQVPPIEDGEMEPMSRNPLRAFITYYVHHVDAESLRLALELSCAICIRLWSGFEGKRQPPQLIPRLKHSRTTGSDGMA
jgi:hypothetical protein